MKNLFLAAIIVAALILPGEVYAAGCSRPSGKQAIERYDIIFKGKALSTKPIDGSFSEIWHPVDSYTEFEVLKAYKGDLSDTVNIYHRIVPTKHLSINFDKDGETMVFAFRNKDDWCVTGMCGGMFLNLDPKHLYELAAPEDLKGPFAEFLLENPEKDYQRKRRKQKKAIGIIEELEIFRSRIQLADALIQEHGQSIFYEHKGQLLEEYRLYGEAVETYRQGSGACR